MVQMLTPITPKVLRYGSQFLKEGVMGLADSVTTIEMQQQPHSMKNPPVFRCPLKEMSISICKSLRTQGKAEQVATS